MRSPTFKYEKELMARGYRLIAGVDEAGTGALAGPVVAAAVILPSDSRIGLLRDSKLLSASQRETVLELLKKCGVQIGTGLVTIMEINQMNIRRAALLAMRRAVAALASRPDALLIDAFKIPGLKIFQKSIIRGDRLVKSIAAASIVAKVTRDNLMQELAQQYPDYGFGLHKGYGTAAHLAALRRLGISPAHRLNYQPIRQLQTRWL